MQGKKTKPFNPFKSDVFSFGLTLYNVVTLKEINNFNDSKEALEKGLE